ncbi:unnamed protein product [Cylindrotheca closterium]|uniref:Uncharacterized protein n=1 Tax=Cylindrotheca closterium TaxID=2856 RepID=A0AAD2JL95_9STRA|nr:unnamed protein product [Cylindrotheca closterium]
MCNRFTTSLRKTGMFKIIDMKSPMTEAIEADDNDDLSVPEGVAEDKNVQQEEQLNVPTDVPIPNQAIEEDETLNQTLQNLQEQAKTPIQAKEV